jgi:PEGA domain
MAMKGRQKAMVLGAFLSALGTQALWADDNRAVPRGGGSSGGGHSDGGSSAGSSHHSSSSGSSGSSSSDSSSYSSGREHHSRPPQTDAQRRKPTPGTGSGYRHHDGRYYGGGGYYGGGYYGSRYSYGYYPYWSYGYFYSPWYYPSYGGWYGGYGYGGYGGYDAPYRRGYGNAGSVRVMVEPRETKVYVDDYYAGVADDFDGIFQRLNLSTGRHDITLRLGGYETLKVKLYVPYDHTIKIKHEMVRGSSEKVTESTVGDPVDEARYSRDPDDDYENSRDHRDETRPDNRGERGTVRLDVSPADASIYVDGVFRGTGSDLRKVTLPEGRHRFEVVRPGYRTLERDVDVTAGEIEEVDVDLPRS